MFCFAGSSLYWSRLKNVFLELLELLSMKFSVSFYLFSSKTDCDVIRSIIKIILCCLHK